MILSEAMTVMKIMATADNWCSQCGPSLIEQFTKAFPQFADIALTEKDINKLKQAYDKKCYDNIDKDIFETNVWELD